MPTEIPPYGRTRTAAAAPPALEPAPSPSPASAPSPVREFAMRFTSTPRGARLARRLVSHRLDGWGFPYGSGTNDAVTLVTAELAANAVRHGHVPGRGFHLLLTASPAAVRVEVSDGRAERAASPTAPAAPCPEAESGRGLVLVSCLATRWAVAPRRGAPGKTVWAEFSLD
ncbi:ATP-binding protein [Streptomyces sp. HB2AG]|nr:ATP-binding protein [Streptomyces sp. HB2AG]